MYAVFVTAEIDSQRTDEARTLLEERIVPKIKESPGFLSGTWARGAEGGEARSMVLFDSESHARETFDAIAAAMPADGPTKILSATFLEVALQV